MSAIEYFLNKGYTPVNKVTIVSGTDTFTIWNPDGNKRVYITDMSVSSISDGTMEIYNDHDGPTKLAEFMLSGSAPVSPIIGCIESTIVGGNIFARTKTSATGGIRVNLTGFELE